MTVAPSGKEGADWDERGRLGRFSHIFNVLLLKKACDAHLNLLILVSGSRALG